MVKTISDLQHEIHSNAKSKGFYDKDKNIGEMIALIHSEASEALEADRNNKYCSANIGHATKMYGDDDFVQAYRDHVKGTFEEEIADIFIRVADLSEYKGIDLQAHIEAKMRYNSLREKMHGKKY